MFIFQPSEERADGARAMIKDGLFTAGRTPVAIFGLHASPLEVGRITAKVGVMMNANAMASGVSNDALLYATAVKDLVQVVGASIAFGIRAMAAVIVGRLSGGLTPMLSMA